MDVTSRRLGKRGSWTAERLWWIYCWLKINFLCSIVSILRCGYILFCLWWQAKTSRKAEEVVMGTELTSVLGGVFVFGLSYIPGSKVKSTPKRENRTMWIRLKNALCSGWIDESFCSLGHSGHMLRNWFWEGSSTGYPERSKWKEVHGLVVDRLINRFGRDTGLWTLRKFTRKRGWFFWGSTLTLALSTRKCPWWKAMRRCGSISGSPKPRITSRFSSRISLSPHKS